jgi:hypothetical protein
VNSIGKVPYGHLLVNSGSSSLSAGRLLGSLCETSLTPLSLESSIDPPLFKIRTSFFQAFFIAIEVAALAQLIFSPFSCTMWPFNFLSSFTIFAKEKLEDKSSIMIDAKETKTKTHKHIQVHIRKFSLLETMMLKCTRVFPTTS